MMRKRGMMRNLVGFVLYTALGLGANVAQAQDSLSASASKAEITALLEGDMQKLALHDAPKPVPDALLLQADETEIALSSFQGRWVVLNFWATWCAPCRREMPSLDRLQLAFPDLAVLPVATGRNAPEAIARFYTEAAIVNLPTLRDPQQTLARQMGVLGLPVTVILNPEGQEVARLIGDAEWDSPSALAVIDALMPAD